MMDVTSYSSLAEWMEGNMVMLKQTIVQETRNKEYFLQFDKSGMFPAEIVTDSFMHLLVLCLKNGSLESLIQQYRWTAVMLEGRGVARNEFIHFFDSYLASACEAMSCAMEGKALSGSLETLFRELRHQFREMMGNPAKE